MHSIHLFTHLFSVSVLVFLFSGLVSQWFSGSMLPVLATLLKVGDANGAELALLGSPTVFR